MSLINCPECNKVISDKAHSCPNCGYPITDIPDIQNVNEKYNIVFISYSSNNDNKIKTIGYLRNIHHKSLRETMDIEKQSPYTIFSGISFEQMKTISQMLKLYDCKFQIESYKISDNETDEERVNLYYQNKDVLQCPRCGSTQISIGQRGYSLIAGFFGSNKTVNRCGKCGFSWKP